MPGKKAGGRSRQTHPRSCKKIPVSGFSQSDLAENPRAEVEASPRQIKCNRKMDQHDMLRVLGEHHGLRIEGIEHRTSSLHHDGAGHFGVDRAEIGIIARLVEHEGERFVGIEDA